MRRWLHILLVLWAGSAWAQTPVPTLVAATDTTLSFCFETDPRYDQLTCDVNGLPDGVAPRRFWTPLPTPTGTPAACFIAPYLTSAGDVVGPCYGCAYTPTPTPEPQYEQQSEPNNSPTISPTPTSTPTETPPETPTFTPTPSATPTRTNPSCCNCPGGPCADGPSCGAGCTPVPNAVCG